MKNQKWLILGAGGEGAQTERASRIGESLLEALEGRGVEAVVLESNPATRLVDSDVCARAYLEPLTPEVAERIVAQEKPNAVLAWLGGTAALQVVRQLSVNGSLARSNTEALGLTPGALEAVLDVRRQRNLLERGQLPLAKAVPAADLAASSLLQVPVRLRGAGFSSQTFATGAAAHAALGDTPNAWLEETSAGALFRVVIARDAAAQQHVLGVSGPRQSNTADAATATKLALQAATTFAFGPGVLEVSIGFIDNQPAVLDLHPTLTAAVDEVARSAGLSLGRLLAALLGGEPLQSAIAGAAVPESKPAHPDVVLLTHGVQPSERAELTWAVRQAELALTERGLNVAAVSSGAIPAARALLACLGGDEAVETALEAQARGQVALGVELSARPLLKPEALPQLAARVGVRSPWETLAKSQAELLSGAETLGFPLIVRALPGGEPRLIHTAAELPKAPAQLARFLSEATQLEVDVLRDSAGKTLVVAVVEQVEQAGVCSPDAAWMWPPASLTPGVVEKVKDVAAALAAELRVTGPLHLRLAAQGKELFLLDVTPRLARTVAFLSRATGLELPKLAVRLAMGETLAALGLSQEPSSNHVAVREAVLSAVHGDDVVLGTTSRSRGEVMGLGDSLPEAFAKSQVAAGAKMKTRGRVLLSVGEADRPAVVDLAKRLETLGFTVEATEPTAKYLADKHVTVKKQPLLASSAPVLLAALRKGELSLLCTTAASEEEPNREGETLRREALATGVPYFTTVEALRLWVASLEALVVKPVSVRALSEWTT